MKIFKKVSMVLCMCFAFTGIATGCDGLLSDPLNKNSAKDSVPTESVPSENDSTGDLKDDVVASMWAFKEMVNETLTGAKAAKISFGFDVSVAVSEGGESEDTVQPVAAADEVDALTSMLSLDGSLTVSETTAGGAAMKLDLGLTSEGETENITVYYIDDYVYLYDAESDQYGKTHYALSEYVENLVHQATQGEYTLEMLAPELEALLADMELPEVDLSNVWTLLTDYGVKADVFNSEIGMKINFSYQDAINNYLATYADLTMESSLKDLLTSQIAYFDPTFDLENLLVGLASQGNKTVNDLANILENESQSMTGASLQENLDALLADEMIQSILAEQFDEETLAMINGFELEAFLAENGTLSLDDFAKYVTEDETVDWMTLVGAVKQQLETLTLADLDDEEGTVAGVLAAIQAIDFGIVSESYTCTTSQITFETALGVSVDGVAGDELACSFYFTVAEISGEGVTIALPEGANVVTMYENCGYCGVGNETVSYVEALFGYYCADCVEELTCDNCGKVDEYGAFDETEYFCEDCWDTNNGSSAEE